MKDTDPTLSDERIDAARPVDADGLSAFVRAGGLGDGTGDDRELLDERRAFLESHPVDDFLATLETTTPPEQSGWARFVESVRRRAIPVFATAGVLTLALAVIPLDPEPSSIQPPRSTEGVRAKGQDHTRRTAPSPAMINAQVGLGFDLVTPRGAIAGTSGGTYRKGDHLRFTYSLDSPGHLYLISVDNAGKVTPFYPPEWAESLAVPPGRDLPLEASIRLDDYVGYEGFIAVFSEQPIPGQSIQKAAHAAFKSARTNGHDIRAVHRLPGLGDAAQISMWIEKVAH